MPSTSRSQQRLMGMVHAYQKGALSHAPAKIKQVAKHISSTDAKHFAATKHTGLPEHVKGAASELEKGIKEEAEHGPSMAMRKRVAKDHLREDAHYYTKLQACMDKKSDCADRDKNIPKAFDNRQLPFSGKAKSTVSTKTAFAAGFMKQAVASGLTEGEAYDLFQKVSASAAQ